MNEYIKLEDCKDRHIYLIHSRDLNIGVFVKETNSFIGIRLKFKSLYLCDESHFDNGSPFGTAMPYKDIGILPDEITASETLGTKDPNSGQELMPDPNKHGSWVYCDTGRPYIYSKHNFPICIENDVLFNYLNNLSQGE